MSRRRRAGVMGLALALGLAGCAGPTEVDRLHARSTYERGLTHLQERQVSLAVSSIQEAIALDGTNPIYRNSLGTIYMQLQRPDRALEKKCRRSPASRTNPGATAAPDPARDCRRSRPPE